MEKTRRNNSYVFGYRRQLACLLILTMIISLVPMNSRTVQAADPDTFWTDTGVRAAAFGVGQENIDAKTLIIKTAEELGLFAYNVNKGYVEGETYYNGYAGWTIVLANDINLSGHAWKPVGSNVKPFSGNFNGNNHTISNISIIISDFPLYIGFFGDVWSASINNMTVSGDISTPNVGIMDNYVGGIAGLVISSSITNCTSNMAINYSLYGNIGGIAAYIKNSSITNCVNNAEINAVDMQGANVGGIVGQVYSYSGTSAISNCRNSGKVNVTAVNSGTINVGGIVGNTANDSVIYDCRNDGDVSCSLSQVGTCVGGIVGNSYNAIVINCQSTGNIAITENTDPQFTYIGGITGYSSSSNYSYNKGIINCNSRNIFTDLAVNDKTFLGGIAGYISNSAVNNYFAGSICSTVSGSAIGFITGFAAEDQSSTKIYNYYTTETSAATGTAIGVNQLTNYGGSEAVIEVLDSAMKLTEGMSGALVDMMNQNLNKSDVANFVSTGYYATKWFVNSSINDGYPCTLKYDPSAVLGCDKTVNANFRQMDENSVMDSDTIDIVTSARTPDTIFHPTDFSIRDGAAATAATLSGLSITDIDDDTAASTRLTIQMAKGVEAESAYLWYLDTCVGEITIHKTINSFWTEKGIRAEAFGTGQSDGTAKTLVIKTAAELGLFAYNINSGTNYKGWTVTLDDDISLSGHLWEPAGNSFINGNGQVDRPFSGTFDGNGHTIADINIKILDSGNFGFFGLVYDSSGTDACIKNLTACGNIITIDNFPVFTGGIVAMAGNASIKNCSNFIQITLNGQSGYAGGIAGYIFNSSITDSVNYASVVEKGADAGIAGGIAGLANTSEIKTCINHGTVSYDNSGMTGDHGNVYMGGIAAMADYSVIVDNCMNDGIINANIAIPSTVFMGGIVGSSDGGITVLNCQTRGSMKAASCIHTELTLGGITGKSTSDTGPGVINCYSRSNILISGTADSINAGGIVGDTYDHLINNYFAGSIESTAVNVNENYIGFITGQVDSDPGDADSHIDGANSTCYYLAYNYYVSAEATQGSALGYVDIPGYTDPNYLEPMAKAITESNAKLAAGAQAGLVEKLNNNRRNFMVTALLPTGHTASAWYCSGMINDGYPCNRYYAPGVTLGADKTVHVTFQSSDKDTATAVDTIDVITLACTDDTAYSVDKFSIGNGAASEHSALAGVSITGIKTSPLENAGLIIKVAKNVTNTIGYLWYGNTCIGQISISKTVTTPTPTITPTSPSIVTPTLPSIVTPTPKATPVPTAAPKVKPEPTKTPTPTPVVATIEVSQGSGAGKDGNTTITVPKDTLEKYLSDGSIDEVELELKLSDDKAEDRQGTNDIILGGSILQSAKESGKDLSVSVKDSDGKERYTWTFDTNNAVSSDVKMEDVNLSLEVKEIKDTTAIQETMGDNEKGLILEFAEEGTLPSQAMVRIYVGDQPGVQPGNRIYLYHFNDETNKLETLPYSSEYYVDESGYITVTIVHCSDYVVLLEKADAKSVTSLNDQITVSIDKKTLYLDNKKKGFARIKVNLPATLELIASFNDNTSQSAVGGVTASYSTGNKKVAVVDKNGHVIAVGAGKALITLKLKLYSGKTKTVKFTITVKKHKKA